MPSLPNIRAGGNGRIELLLGDGVTVRFDPEDVRRPTDILDQDDPRFVGVVAAFKWLRQRGATWATLRQSAQLRADYAAATFTLEVSP